VLREPGTDKQANRQCKFPEITQLLPVAPFGQQGFCGHNPARQQWGCDEIVATRQHLNTDIAQFN
jgi:hypothetical protein